LDDLAKFSPAPVRVAVFQVFGRSFLLGFLYGGELVFQKPGIAPLAGRNNLARNPRVGSEVLSWRQQG
jgi:hypothetical protein